MSDRPDPPVAKQNLFTNSFPAWVWARVRAFFFRMTRTVTAERADEKLQRKNIVKMGIKVVQMASAPPPPTPTPRSEQPKGWRQRGPQATSEKPFLLSDGKVTLEANLDKAIYTHGDPIRVNISVRNTSKKSVRRIKVIIAFGRARLL